AANLGRLDNEEIIARLTEIRGIGRWTVEMMLMFHLGRPDVLALDDYGLRKGFAVTFGTGELATRKELEAHGERWRPFRSVASWYLWRALELPAADDTSAVKQDLSLDRRAPARQNAPRANTGSISRNKR